MATLWEKDKTPSHRSSHRDTRTPPFEAHGQLAAAAGAATVAVTVTTVVVTVTTVVAPPPPPPHTTGDCACVAHRLQAERSTFADDANAVVLARQSSVCARAILFFNFRFTHHSPPHYRFVFGQAAFVFPSSRLSRGFFPPLWSWILHHESPQAPTGRDGRSAPRNRRHPFPAEFVCGQSGIFANRRRRQISAGRLQHSGRFTGRKMQKGKPLTFLSCRQAVFRTGWHACHRRPWKFHFSVITLFNVYVYFTFKFYRSF